MRRAEFGVDGDDGTAGLVVYFFGNQGAGSAQANTDRWVGQFKNADGTPITASKPVTRKIAGLEVTQIEVAGILPFRICHVPPASEDSKMPISVPAQIIVES